MCKIAALFHGISFFMVAIAEIIFSFLLTLIVPTMPIASWNNEIDGSILHSPDSSYYLHQSIFIFMSFRERQAEETACIIPVWNSADCSQFEGWWLDNRRQLEEVQGLLGAGEL